MGLLEEMGLQAHLLTRGKQALITLEDMLCDCIVMDTHLGDMAFSSQQVRFGLAKFDSLPGYCRSCEFLSLCNGECPKNRIVRTPTGEPGLNYLCGALKRFYAQVQRDMPEICRRLGISNGRAA